jgi:hypothetical protein
MKKPSFFTSTMPPTIQDVKSYFGQKGMPDLEADHFFLFYEKKEWKSKNGNFLKSWKNIACSCIISAVCEKLWRFNKSMVPGK